MKSKILFLAIALSLHLSCQNQPNYETSNNVYSEANYHNDIENNIEIISEDNSIFKDLINGGTKTHELRDARTGIVAMTCEYPSSWKVISKPAYTFDQKVPMFLTQIQGPHNLQSFNTPIYFNIDYPDPQIRQWMKGHSSLGKLVKPMMSREQIMQEEVSQRMAKSGFNLLGRKQIPRAENYLRKKMNENSISESAYEYYATEWTNNKGQKALVNLLHVKLEQFIPILGGNMVLWFYSVDYTFVDENHFESTLDQMADAMESTNKTTQWKQYENQLQQVRQQQAIRDAEIARRDRQAAFNAHQRKMQGMSAAQDLNHASFMNRNFGSGSGTAQRQFVNMINEEETVYNPSTGTNYQVNAGSTEYWMDSDRNYISNDNLFYNPNGDINLNNKEWKKVKKAYQ